MNCFSKYLETFVKASSETLRLAPNISLWYDKHLSGVFLFNFEHDQEIISVQQPITCWKLETKAPD